ncbi:L-threonate dehydrogenase [Cupriavidus taiwanensis]|uniref:L-threonate dehydrogenase n=1 Tax=Cupriavidus taiwanensis TaxID=164546 RepID=UPI000E100159|nr:L-threonate dehydrogenase [Cupriavidus taiwanensis]SOY43514.1 putative 3-hydroxyisobutyrate dehydrogenase; putative exported protein [Cupriavidus taiwanensis]SOY59290.1 putative 3-hydroxyisobutyrate dehydrogenase; putative exported protein [Cupriavidus taiwanensis]SOY80240.1 putative 3-hydroxyisobutyrate dehydrogenase; putative exported protein [Cupriavidus taiwanensis]SOZ51450.1 putative 3-hydroxyisobutyrate dehydrogenase; putative exported protein [Cupriavidus taiwanensis]SOZ76336.1 putat
MSRNIGVIGLGAMGFGVAQSLLRAGFNVHACDLRAEVLQRFADAGGVPCASPAELGSHCEVVLTLVVNAQQTEAVLFGADGAVAAMQPGKLVIASATVPPGFAETLAQRLAEKGLLMLDAPVSGGAARAASGEMTMMTSGPAEAYALAEDVLAAIAGKVYRLGAAHGAGSRVKIINQLLAGVHIAAAAEAMALGLREGVDPDALYDVITHSAGNSWMFENRVPHILKGDYTPLSAVDIFVKDLGMVLDTARTSKFPLPLSAAAHQMFMMASTAGHGGEDDSAVIKIFPGIELPGQAE